MTIPADYNKEEWVTRQTKPPSFITRRKFPETASQSVCMSLSIPGRAILRSEWVAVLCLLKSRGSQHSTNRRSTGNLQ